MLKPKLFISACLEFEKVRYNGQFVPSKIVRDLIPFVDFIKTCPENEIGLGVPREPIRIVKKNNQHRLIQHKTELDVTDKMNDFCKSFVNNLEEVDGFILKSKSPTMGIDNIKVYHSIDRGSGVAEKCGGFFAERIKEKFFGHPIEEEDRLRNKIIRKHFLVQLFLFAKLREAVKEKSLQKFHEENKLLLLFYSKDKFINLDPEKDNYLQLIKEVVEKPPKSKEIADFFEELMIGKKDAIKEYRENKMSFETLFELSKIFIKDKDLLTQSFYNPFPAELTTEAEEDRDKDYWK